MADRLWRHESAIKMNTFDKRVDRQHLNPVSLRFDDGCVVSDANQEPVGGGRELPPNSSDELCFSDFADSSSGIGRIEARDWGHAGGLHHFA